MELIPILSTIILIATISTFILAIGAYILYKVRERKRHDSTEQYSKEVDAEVISPAYPPEEIPNVKKQNVETKTEIFEEAKEDLKNEKIENDLETSKVEKEIIHEPLYEDEYFEPEIPKKRDEETTIKHWRSRATKNSRFLKYTSEGYVIAKGDRNSGVKKWR